MVIATRADFRNVKRIWGIAPKAAMVYIGACYAGYFGFQEEDAIRIIKSMCDNTKVYVLGGGTHQRLPVGGDGFHGMVDYPLALSEFNRDDGKRYSLPKSAIYLPSFPVSAPSEALKTFSEAPAAEGKEVPRSRLARIFREFYKAHTMGMMTHEVGHLFPKYWRVDHGVDEPSPNKSVNPRERLADEAACMFYTDATYGGALKAFELDEDAGDIWKRAIEQHGEKSAQEMFLTGNYNPLLSREEFMYLLDEWGHKISQTKKESVFGG